MDSPFTASRKVVKKLKIMVWGASGIGKTRFALRFPRPAVIDMERGTDWYGDEFQFGVMHTHSPVEVLQAIEWLVENGREQYDTIVIDPITVLYEQLQAVQQKIVERRAARNAKGPIDLDDVSLTFADRGKIKEKWTAIFTKCVNAGYHVVGVARENDEYRVSGGGKEIAKVGIKPGAHASAMNWFDTRVHLVRKGDGVEAVLEKDRTYLFGGEEVLSLQDLTDRALQAANATSGVESPVEPGDGVSESDVQAVEQALREESRPAAARPEVSPEKQKVPCPRGCGGFIIEKTVAKTGAKFYGCSSFQSDLKCRATMTHKEYDIATGGTAEKPVEAPKPEPEAEPDLAIDTIWRQTWRERLVPLSLGEDAVRHDLGRLFDGDLDRMPAKYRKRALERMKEMAGQSTETSPFDGQ